MEKTINALKARQNLGQILEEVYYKGDYYVIERAGKPMAVVVPIARYSQWKERSERLLAMIDEVWATNADVAPEIIEAEVARAVRETRLRWASGAHSAHQHDTETAMQGLQYTVVIEPDQGGFHAYVPSLPGCHSFGATIDEARANIQEAMQLHIECLQEDGERVPPESEPLFITRLSVPLPA